MAMNRTRQMRRVCGYVVFGHRSKMSVKLPLRIMHQFSFHGPGQKEQLTTTRKRLQHFARQYSIGRYMNACLYPVQENVASQYC